MESPEGAEALAADEIAAAAAGAPIDANASTERALEWASARAGLAELIPVAIRAVDRVVADDSELWTEGDDLAWLKATDDLRTRLRSRAEAGQRPAWPPRQLATPVTPTPGGTSRPPEGSRRPLCPR